MSEELTRKRKVRGGNRASAKRILGDIQTTLSSEPTDTARITKLHQIIEEKLKVLTALDEEILALTDNDSIEEEIVIADQFKEVVQGASSELAHVLNPVTALSKCNSCKRNQLCYCCVFNYCRAFNYCRTFNYCHACYASSFSRSIYCFSTCAINTSLT